MASSIVAIQTEFSARCRLGLFQRMSIQDIETITSEVEARIQNTSI